LAVRHVVVDADDVFVRQRGERAGFAVEAPSLLGVLGKERAEQLDRDVTLELPIASVPDDSHPAFADLLEQLVATRQDRHQRTTSTPQLSEPSVTATTRFVGDRTIPPAVKVSLVRSVHVLVGNIE